MSDLVYAPGSLVSARGREWVVLSGSSAETLRVRPVTGSDEDQTLIHLPLEVEPVSRGSVPPAKRASARRARLGPSASRRVAALTTTGRRTLSELWTDLG